MSGTTNSPENLVTHGYLGAKNPGPTRRGCRRGGSRVPDDMLEIGGRWQAAFPSRRKRAPPNSTLKGFAAAVTDTNGAFEFGPLSRPGGGPIWTASRGAAYAAIAISAARNVGASSTPGIISTRDARQ